MMNPMRILVRLVMNWKFLEIISRFCATLSAICDGTNYKSHENPTTYVRRTKNWAPRDRFVHPEIHPEIARTVLPIHLVGRTLRSSPRTKFDCSPPVSRLISFSPTCSLLLLLQASTTGNIGSEAANPVVSSPHRLRTSEIPKTLWVSLVVTPACHHLPALPSKIGELRQNRY